MAATNSGKLFKACVVIVALMIMNGGGQLQATAAGPENITCQTVTENLINCFAYVMGGGGTVPENCCSGVKKLYNLANSTPARRVVCQCLKSVTRTASNTTVHNAQTLPGKCGVRLPFVLTPTIDCNTVK